VENNSSIFECINKFNNECNKDIDKLIQFSREYDESVQLFISSAIVLLGAKFESCIENIISEYVDKINTEADKNLIPNTLKYSSIYHKLSNYKDKLSANHFNCFSNDGDFLTEIELFINNVINNSNNLIINNKFNYGKHGYKELVNLFNNIEINIKDDCFDKQHPKSELYDYVIGEISFESKFNEFMNYRNKVAHQNEYPNITSDDIKKIVETFKEFIKSIDLELCSRIKKMKNNISESIEKK
jgi:hypothetical protein